MQDLDFKSYIEKRPEFFFGQRGINPLDICTHISQGAIALGANKVQMGTCGSWHYVCADFDWFKSDLKQPYENEQEIFEKFHAFPEYFQNSTRYEPFTNFYSEKLVTSSYENIQVVKGKELAGQLFENEFPELINWARVIGFVFNRDA